MHVLVFPSALTCARWTFSRSVWGGEHVENVQIWGSMGLPQLLTTETD